MRAALVDAGIVDDGLLAEAELDAALDPLRALGAATAVVDRVVGSRPGVVA